MTNPSVSPTILIVDDSDINTMLLDLQLKMLGVPNVARASNGVEALRWLAHNPCQLVLTDCQMPEMDGLEMTRKIRAADADWQQPRIVALTAGDLEQSRADCLAAGMQDCYTRPVELDDLAAILGVKAD
jgi:CheY-like chemotaxis protein